MAGTLKINGVTVPIVGYSNSVTIPWSNPFTITWSGMASDSYGQVFVDFDNAAHDSNCFSFSGNTGVSPSSRILVDFTGNDSGAAGWAAYYRASSAGSLTVYSSKSFIGQRILVGYNNSRDSEDGSCDANFVDPYTAPSAPTSVSVDTSSVVPGGTTTLRWSGAKAGQNVSISGYHIYRATSPSGSYSYLGAVSTSATSGSMAVTAPTANGSSYYYKVYTIGSVSGYNSDISSAYAGLTAAVSSPANPGNIRLSTTTVAPGAAATLYWDAASAGTNNLVSGYNVYRSASADGSFTKINSSLITGTSLSVTAPTTNNTAYYYKVEAVGSVSGYNSNYGSETPASLTGVASKITGLTVSLPGTVSSNDNVVLSWTGATNGTNNVLTGYIIDYRTVSGGTYGEWVSVATVDTSVRSRSVAVPTTLGDGYQYRVIATGSAGSAFYSDPVYATVVRSASLTAPSNLRLSAASGSTVAASWTASVLSGATGTILYSIRKNGTQFATTENTSFTIPESTMNTWGTSPVTITVVATVSALSLVSGASNGVSFTYDPSLTGAGNVALAAATGQTADLSWTPGSTGDGSSVSYSIKVDNVTAVSGITGLSYSLPMSSYQGSTVTIKLVTHGAGKTVESAGMSFTYKDPHRLVRYRLNGAWVEGYMKVYTNGAWVEVRPKYRNASGWGD